MSQFTPSLTGLPSVVGADQKVPTVDGGLRRAVNLDLAATAPALVAVEAAVAEVLPYNASVHRGAGYHSGVVTRLVEVAREQVASFLGAPAGTGVVFTRNTTDALELLAACLPEGTSVVCFASEHHANLLPWHRGDVVVLPPPPSPEAAVEAAVLALRRLPRAPRLLAVTGASNVTGEVWPLAELVAAAHAEGARVVVDAAQLAPHRPVDLGALGADYLACSGHKLYAPFGSGVLIGREDWLDAAPAYLRGGGAVERVRAGEAGDIETTWSVGPARHEAGTPNLVGIVALAAACRSLADTGMSRVAEHERALRAHLVAELATRPALTTYALWSGVRDRVGVVPFNVGDHPAGLVAATLGAEYGIAVRAGAFCAHPLVDRLTGDRGGGPGAVRVSFGLGTNHEDLDHLLAALDELAEKGPRWTYRRTGASYLPDPDPRPAPSFAHLAWA